MDAFELNKAAGAVLGALLFVVGSGFIAELIYHPKPAGKAGYDLPESEPQAAAEAPEAKVEPIAVRLASANAEKGEAGTKACHACHNFEKGGPNKVGPDLYGVVERPKGGHPGFEYSAALKKKGGTWTYADLDAFLTNPKGYAKGTKMAFAGIASPQERANVIAYLRTLSDKFVTEIAKPVTEIAKPVTESMETLTRRAYESFQIKNAKYNVPGPLRYGEIIEISLVILQTDNGNDTQNKIDDSQFANYKPAPLGNENIMEGFRGRVESFDIKVSDKVEAILTGTRELVEIKLRDDYPKLRTITSVAPVRWIWDVKAIGVGTAMLNLDVSAFAHINGKEERLRFEVFHKEIAIKITMLDWTKKFVAELTPIWAFIYMVAGGVASFLTFIGWKPLFRGSRPS